MKDGPIAHPRVELSLSFKARPAAQPFKMLIFVSKDENQDSL